MDLVHILRALWQDRRWVAVGALVAAVLTIVATFRVSPLSLSLTPRTSQIAAATTEVLVDSEQTFLGDLRREIDPLTQRAGAYAHFVESEAVVDALAEASGIPAEQIAVRGPVANASEAADPTSEQRANDIREASERFRVQVTFNGELPVLSIYTQAPTVDGALQLANGMARALRAVVASIGDRSENTVASENRVRIRQLGKAEGGVITDRASYALAMLVFIGVFGAACVLILVARNFRAAWRAEDAGTPGLDSDRDLEGTPSPPADTAMIGVRRAHLHETERAHPEAGRAGRGIGEDPGREGDVAPRRRAAQD